MHCSRKLIVQTLVFSRSFLHRQMSPPETLVVKRGTTWSRNGRWILPENARLPRNIQGYFTCRKSKTWDKQLYFPSEGRRAEDFFRPEKSDGFGRVLTPRTWVPKTSTLPLDHRSRFFRRVGMTSLRHNARDIYLQLASNSRYQDNKQNWTHHWTDFNSRKQTSLHRTLVRREIS